MTSYSFGKQLESVLSRARALISNPRHLATNWRQLPMDEQNRLLLFVVLVASFSFASLFSLFLILVSLPSPPKSPAITEQVKPKSIPASPSPMDVYSSKNELRESIALYGDVDQLSSSVADLNNTLESELIAGIDKEAEKQAKEEQAKREMQRLAQAEEQKKQLQQQEAQRQVLGDVQLLKQCNALFNEFESASAARKTQNLLERKALGCK